MKKNILALAIAGIALGANAGTVTSKGDDIIVSTKGGFKVQTADKSKSFNLGGRIQWDYDNTEVDGDSDAKTNDMGIRRARIFLKGQVDDWGYKAQFNIGEDGSDAGSVEDLYIRYTGFGKKANVTIGRQKEPFGLEEQTSSKDISILERSAITEQFAFGRNTGVQLHGKGSNWTYGVGLFENGSGSKEAEEVAATGRVTFAPIKEKDSVLHLGLGASKRSGDMTAYNFELAGVAGPVHAQFEYFSAEDDEVNFDEDGFYGQVGWILTGESRPYKDGKFKIVKPSSKSGAWEIVARYEDGFGKYSDVGLTKGVEGEQLALGVNFYPNSNVRLGASWMTGEEDITGAEGDEFRFRVQYVYK